jgi:hypothetical protein
MKVNRKFNDLTKEDKKNLVVALQETPNMKEFLVLLTIIFDLEQNQPGAITKALISEKIVSLVLPMINPKIKE